MKRFVDEIIERKASFFVPGGPKGSSQVTERKGYVLRERGDTADLRERLGVEPRLVAREFVCPVHGRFTVETDEGCDEVACPRRSWCVWSSKVALPDDVLEREWPSRMAIEDHLTERGIAWGELSFASQSCGDTSPWAGERIGVGKSSGEVTC